MKSYINIGRKYEGNIMMMSSMFGCEVREGREKVAGSESNNNKKEMDQLFPNKYGFLSNANAVRPAHQDFSWLRDFECTCDDITEEEEIRESFIEFSNVIKDISFNDDDICFDELINEVRRFCKDRDKSMMAKVVVLTIFTKSKCTSDERRTVVEVLDIDSCCELFDEVYATFVGHKKDFNLSGLESILHIF